MAPMVSVALYQDCADGQQRPHCYQSLWFQKRALCGIICQLCMEGTFDLG